MKTSDRAISILRGRPAFSRDVADELAEKQQKEIDIRTNPDLVAPKTRNPFGREATTRRKAQHEALEGRLAIFRDNILAVRASNNVMNNAAIIQVMLAAEQFIIELRSVSENRRHQTLSAAQLDLLCILENELREVNKLAGGGILPKEILDTRVDNALAEYAERSLKIAGLDFEFDKQSLLKLRDHSA